MLDALRVYAAQKEACANICAIMFAILMPRIFPPSSFSLHRFDAPSVFHFISTSSPACLFAFHVFILLYVVCHVCLIMPPMRAAQHAPRTVTSRLSATA